MKSQGANLRRFQVRSHGTLWYPQRVPGTLWARGILNTLAGANLRGFQVRSHGTLRDPQSAWNSVVQRNPGTLWQGRIWEDSSVMEPPGPRGKRSWFHKKKILSVYTHSMETIYLSLSAQVQRELCYKGTMPRLVSIETCFYGIIHCSSEYLFHEIPMHNMPD